MFKALPGRKQNERPKFVKCYRCKAGITIHYPETMAIINHYCETCREYEARNPEKFILELPEKFLKYAGIVPANINVVKARK